MRVTLERKTPAIKERPLVEMPPMPESIESLIKELY